MTRAVNLDAVGRTALVTAAMRAAETSRPDALHQDPYAAALAGELGLELLEELLAAASAVTPTPAPASAVTPDGTATAASAGSASRRAVNAIRTRFFDAYLRAATEEAGIRQVVVAGAGMDARAYRMRWPDGVRYFEVDRPAVLDYKQERLATETPRADHRLVRRDLTSPTWPQALVEAGYRPDEPSVWLLEGLLFYIPEDGVHRVLDQVAELSAPGSRIAADVVNAAALTLPRQRVLLDVFARWGCPWQFGCDAPQELFARHGFAAEVVQPGELGEEFGRVSEPVVAPEVTGVYRVFLVTGRRR